MWVCCLFVLTVILNNFFVGVGRRSTLFSVHCLCSWTVGNFGEKKYLFILLQIRNTN